MLSSALRSLPFCSSRARSGLARRTRVRSSVRRPAVVSTESLEDRTLLAVASSFNNGYLVVTADSLDDVIIDQLGGFVQVNGSHPDSGPLGAEVVQAIRVTATGSHPNTIDLSAVNATSFPALTGAPGTLDPPSVTIRGGAGDDQLIGPDMHAFIEGQNGNDSILTASGNDTVWGGDGNDFMTVLGGDDSYAGGDGDDTYEFSVAPANLGHDEFDESLSGRDTFDFRHLLGVAYHAYLTTRQSYVLNGDLTMVAGSTIEHILGTIDDDLISAGSVDTLIEGGGGDDVLNGGSGNDTLDGGGNLDVLAGAAGDDTYIIRGGQQRIQESSGVDTLDFSPFNSGITLDLDSTAQQFIAGLVSVELQQTFERVIGTAFADTIDADPLPGFANRRTIVGGDPSAAPGDVLNVDFAGNPGGHTLTGIGSGRFHQFGDFGEIEYQQIESPQDQNIGSLDLIIEPVGNLDSFRLASKGDNLLITAAEGGPIFSLPIEKPDTIVYIGQPDFDDHLELDFSDGSFLPDGGLLMDGGTGGFDSLAIIGDGTTTATYMPDPEIFGNGVVDVSGLPVMFENLEPIDIENMKVATLTLPGASDLLTVADGMTKRLDPGIRVSGTSGGVPIEQAVFRNNTTVVIDTSTNDGTDSITVVGGGNAHGNSNIVINTGNGADLVDVDGTLSVPGRMTITGGGSIGYKSGLLGAGSLHIDIAGQAGVLGSPLRTEVGVVAGSADEIALLDQGALEVGTVGVVSGIASDVLSLTAPDLDIADNINSRVTKLSPSSASLSVGVGGASGNFVLEDAELARISGQQVVIGTLGQTGAVTIDPVDLSSRTWDLEVYGDSVQVTGLNMGTNDITLYGATGITDGGDAVTDIRASSLTVEATGQFDIGGPSDALLLDVDRLTVAGGGVAHLADTATIVIDRMKSRVLSIEGGTFLLGSGSTFDARASVFIESGAILNPNGFAEVLDTVTVNPGGVLTGTGSVFAGVETNGGTIRPGTSPGVLGVGSLDLDATSTLELEINGTTPGTDYDRLDVRSNVKLNGARLQLSGVRGSVPLGTTIVVIDKLRVEPISGTFAGLPEGATVPLNGENYAITYRHGPDSNDVALTRVSGYHVIGSEKDDLLEITQTGPNSGTYRLTTDVGGTPVAGPTVSFVPGKNFEFAGLAGNDELRVTSLAANLFGATERVFFYGGAGSDLLRLSGGPLSQLTHKEQLLIPGSSGLPLPGLLTSAQNNGTAISSVGVERVEDTLSATSREFDVLPPSPLWPTHRLEDVGSDNDGRSRLVGAFGDIDFRHATTDVTIRSTGSLPQGLGGGLGLILSDVDSQWPAELHVNTPNPVNLIDLSINSLVDIVAGDLNVFGPVAADAAFIEASTIHFASAGSLTTTGATGNINFIHARTGDITMADGSEIDAGVKDLNIRTDAGDVTVSKIRTTRHVHFQIGGSIIDGGETDIDIRAGSAMILGRGGDVGSLADQLEIQVGNLAGEASNVFAVSSADPITVGGPRTGSGIQSAGKVRLVSASDVEVAAEIAAASTDPEAIELLASSVRLRPTGKLTSPGGHSIYVSGHVLMDAGASIRCRELEINAQGSNTHQIHLRGDVNAHLTTITTGVGPDEILIQPVFPAEHNANGTTISVGAGDDTVTIHVARSTLTAEVDAGTGTDTLSVIGGDAADWFVNDTSVLLRDARRAHSAERIGHFHVENLSVATGPGPDSVDVVPSPQVTMTVAGGDPTAAPGDSLKVVSSGRAVLASPTVISVAGMKPLNWSEFETIGYNGAASVALTGLGGDDDFIVRAPDPHQLEFRSRVQKPDGDGGFLPDSFFDFTATVEGSTTTSIGGGGGNDRVEFLGGAGNDNLAINDEAALFNGHTVSIDSLDSINASLGEGADTINVTPLAIPVAVDLGPDLPRLDSFFMPGDSFFRRTGTDGPLPTGRTDSFFLTAPTEIITDTGLALLTPGFAPVSYANTHNIQVVGEVAGFESHGTDGNDEFVIQATDPDDRQQLRAVRDLIPGPVVVLPRTLPVGIYGSGGDDVLKGNATDQNDTVDIDANGLSMNSVVYALDLIDEVVVDLGAGDDMASATGILYTARILGGDGRDDLRAIGADGAGPLNVDILGSTVSDAAGFTWHTGFEGLVFTPGTTDNERNAELRNPGTETTTFRPLGPETAWFGSGAEFLLEGATAASLDARRVHSLPNSVTLLGGPLGETLNVRDTQLESVGRLPLDLSGVQQLHAAAQGGADTVNVTPSVSVPISTTGSALVPVGFCTINVLSGGNDVRLRSIDGRSGSFETAGHAPVEFAAFGSLQIDGTDAADPDHTPTPLDVTVPGEIENVRIVLTGQRIQVLDDETSEELFGRDSSLVTAISVTGNDLDNRLVVDFAGGNPVPAGGLWYGGGDQATSTGDSLELRGGESSFVEHRFANASDGTVSAAIDGRLSVITYEGLEPIDDFLVATTRRFVFGRVADDVTLQDDADSANGRMILSSTGTSETVRFAMPTDRLQIATGGGRDKLTAQHIDELYTGSLTFFGGSGRDEIDATRANAPVRLRGNSGQDVLRGGIYADILLGGPDNDTLSGGQGNDLIRGDAGNDLILESITGFAEFSGGQLRATRGTDRVLLTERASVLGGGGPDRIDLSDFPGPATINGSAGDDDITGTAFNDRILGGSGDDNLRGGDGDDVILAASGEDVIEGGDGSDQLDGGADNDVIDGGAGNDVLLGKGGDDLLTGGVGADIVVGHSGEDTLIGWLPAGATGTALSRDVLIGGNHTDLLDGASAEDLLISGSTNHDNKVSRLLDIHAEWNAGSAYSDRVANLRDGSGATIGNNGTTFLQAGATVKDLSAGDVLTGAGSLDWFFAQAGEVSDLAGGEILDLL